MSQSAQSSYLGDGVYGSFDGWQIWLTAMTDGGEARIALDGSTFLNLLAYAQALPRPTRTDPRT